METRDLLLEIGTEEIPARMVENGARNLQRFVTKAMEDAGLTHGGVTSLCTPRRLAVILEGLPVRQEDRDETVTGPGVKIAYGPDGEPTKAAMGFAKGQGVEVTDLARVDSPKGEVVAVHRHVIGRDTLDVLAEALPGVVSALHFPKAMKWEANTGPFVRPVHWICCLFGPDTVPFEFAGVNSDNTSRGHRFLSAGAFPLTVPLEYAAELAKRDVVTCPDERRDMIRRAKTDAEKELGHHFIDDDGLLNEVANLVEKPFLIIARFDESFLELPREVLVTAMRSHQRYFAMEDVQGKLVSTFGVVANNRAKDMDVVVQGNQRVIAARLFDARFFWDQDLKTGLDGLVPRLGERLFLKGAGDMAEKAERIAAIAGAICGVAGLGDDVKNAAVRAATLCKAVLLSQMVGEFPDLQGVMGEYYARAQGETADVSTAIREHYLPRHAGDDLPSTDVGAVLAVADRMDSIIKCFEVGAIPTGSKDPLALRRQAIGILKILVDRGWDFLPSDRPAGKTADFFRERFHGILTADHAIPADYANAVLAGFPDADPSALASRAMALRDFSAQTEGFQDFLDNVFKRVFNILRKADESAEGWRDKADAKGLMDTSRDFTGDLVEPQEIEVERTRLTALSAEKEARESGNYEALLTALYSFRDPLARFFGTGKDGVPVLIAPTEELRLQRLALVERVLSLFNWFADFSKISTR